MRLGTCTNFGLCPKADARELQGVPPNANFVCSQCRRPLAPAQVGQTKSPSPLPILLLVTLLIATVIGALVFFSQRSRRSASEPQSAAAPTTTGGDTPTTALLRLSGS